MSNFYKYICVPFLILMSGMAFAQEKTCLIIEASYVLTLHDDVPIVGEAVVAFQDNAYHMTGNGVESYCDGVDIWTLDHSVKEAYIEPLTADSQSYMQEVAMRVQELQAGSETTLQLTEGVITIKVKSLKKTDRKDISSFRPNKFDSSWIVTDLR